MNTRSAAWFVFLWLTGALLARAGGFQLESGGVRGGVSKRKHGETFSQVEGFANWNAPWRWDYDCGWHLQTRLDLTAGWLSGRGDDAFIGTIGPTLELGRKRFPLTLAVGSSPTILSRYHFGHTDFGIPFQFTTHGDISWEIGSHAAVEIRYQHMSNAEIGPSNPGLNLYMLAVGWRF